MLKKVFNILKNWVGPISTASVFIIKIKKNLELLSQIFKEITEFIIQLKQFILKYKELLEKESKEDFYALVKSADNITEKVANITDELNLKDLSVKLRDLIK